MPDDSRVNYQLNRERMLAEGLKLLSALSSSGIRTPEELLEAEKNRDRKLAQDYQRALSSTYDPETFPLLALDFYLAVSQALKPLGYAIDVEDRKWEVDPQYRHMTITPLMGSMGDEMDVITGNFIYKGDEVLTRKDIEEALTASGTEIYPSDRQMYGMEVHAGNFFGITFPDAKLALEKLKDRGTLGKLRLRVGVNHNWEGYATDADVLYAPQTQDEERTETLAFITDILLREHQEGEYLSEIAEGVEKKLGKGKK